MSDNDNTEDKTVTEVEPAAMEAQETPKEVGESDLRWYVVHTYSGFEQKAKLALQERIRQHKMEKLFAEVLIPSIYTSPSDGSSKSES